MTSGLAALTARRVALQVQCAAERGEVARGYDTVESQLVPVDRTLETVRRLAPVVAVGAIAVLIVAGPARTLNLARRALTLALYASPALRLLRRT